MVSALLCFASLGMHSHKVEVSQSPLGNTWYEQQEEEAEPDARVEDSQVIESIAAIHCLGCNKDPPARAAFCQHVA